MGAHLPDMPSQATLTARKMTRAVLTNFHPMLMAFILEISMQYAV